MKLETFAMLDSVLRHGTMSAAAEAASLTPSAVSIQMKQLERYLGQQLFDRSGLQVRPLPLAREVAAVMRRAATELDTLRRPAGIAVEGQVKLGVIESMQPLLLPGLLQMLRRRYPGLQVQPQRGKSAELTSAVKAGEIDAALVAQPENGGSSRLDWHVILQREMSLIVPPDETETSLTVLFERHEWVRYDRNTIVGRMAARYVHQHVRERRGWALELDGVRAIVAMVSAGLGISVVQLAEPGICAPFPVRVIPLIDAPSVQFSLVSRATDADSRVLQAVREALVDVATAARLNAKSPPTRAG